MEKRGVPYSQMDPEVRAKRDATDKAKNGGVYFVQTNEFSEKSKATNLERRGVEYPAQCQDVLNLREVNYTEKHGVKHQFAHDEVKQKIKETNTKTSL